MTGPLIARRVLSADRLEGTMTGLTIARNAPTVPLLVQMRTTGTAAGAPSVVRRETKATSGPHASAPYAANRETKSMCGKDASVKSAARFFTNGRAQNA